MVLPSSASTSSAARSPASPSASASASTSAATLYAAGNGHVLSHFAGLTTPEPAAQASSRRSKVTLRQRPTASSSKAAAMAAALSSPFDLSAPLDDMGTTNSNGNNQEAVHNLVLPTPVLQDMFERQRDENASQRRRRGVGADGASASASAPSSTSGIAKKDDDGETDSNQHGDAAASQSQSGERTERAAGASLSRVHHASIPLL
ncbi:hypothetical protein PINS_up013473 [Pythium insidiosum]|nr:hypothetical protein PINS_up013473 [Pythium insidiosum]